MEKEVKKFIVKPQQIKNRKFANLFWRRSVRKNARKSQASYFFLFPSSDRFLGKNILYKSGSGFYYFTLKNVLNFL